MTTTTSAATGGVPAPDPDAPRLKTLRADGVWEGRQRTRLSVRHFDLATGEPEKVGGDDSAPTPMELVLAGLDGCLAVVVETVAAELGLELRGIALQSEAVMDTRGFAGVPGVRPYYTEVRTRVEVRLGVAPAQDVARLTSAVEVRCPALTLLRAADVDARVQWEVVR